MNRVLITSLKKIRVKLWGIVGNCVLLPIEIYNKVKPMRFIGNIEAKTDVKGRVFFPAQFRKQLQTAAEERLIMRKDIFQDCLVLYPESVWDEQLNELRRRLNRWNAAHQTLFRQFVADVEIVSPDSNGRILIPKRYLKMCGIDQEVRFIGMDDTIEIWSKQKADTPFMEPEIFGRELEKIMSADVPQQTNDNDE